MDKKNQDQRSGDCSTNIQAGGNVMFNVSHEGVSYQEARQIAIDVFKANFLELAGEAQKVALQRAEELIAAFLEKTQKEDISLNEAKDPDMQYALFIAQRDYARIGNGNLQMLLVDILVERAKTRDNELKKIVLNEAIQVASKLTVKQLNAISIRFLIAESMNHGINSIDTFNAYLKSNWLPFCSEFAKERSDYKHIEYAGCGTVRLINNDIDQCLKSNYPGILSVGFDDAATAVLELTQQQRIKLIIPCLRDSTKLQVAAINDKMIDTVSHELGMSEIQVTRLKNLQNNHLLSKEAVEQSLTSIDSKLSELFNAWKNSGLGSLELTTVGIALAHANIKRTIGIDLDLGIWVK